jgi:ankyrin repeat protein
MEGVKQPSEKETLAAFFAARPTPGDKNDDDNDDDDEDFLEAIKRERAQRRVQEAAGSREVGAFVQEAERAVREGRLMDGVAYYTQALEVDPTNVGVLAARASLCGRLNLHKATLHDGELIVRYMPDWHQGHALCGMALFCLQQYAPAVRAYRRALEYSEAIPAGAGVRHALEDAQSKVDDTLRKAAMCGDVGVLERLLRDGGHSVASEDGLDRRGVVQLEAAESQNGFTALMLAVAAGQLESVQLLLGKGACVDARDKFGKTALMWAASQGNDRMVSALCTGGADKAAVDRSGWDSLMAACHGGHVRLVMVLLQGTDPTRAAADGTSYLAVAAQGGRAEVVRLLLQKGADPAQADQKGRRALELARSGSSAGHREATALLAPLTPAAPTRLNAPGSSHMLIGLFALLAAAGAALMRTLLGRHDADV